MSRKFLKTSFPKNWIEAFKKNNLDTNLDLPIKNISKELEDNKKIAPNINNIFRAFELCEYESTKVVIFGQDPYYQKGYANGLAQEVDILGDGTGAKARVDVVNGKITDVTVSSGGKGYTYGLVDLGTLNSNVSATGRAKLIPIIPPGLGHGSDVYSELGTDKVIIYARFDDSTKDFPVDTKFAQVGIVKNPTKVGTDNIFTDNTFSSLQAFKFSTISNTTTPVVGEEITQVLTVSPNVGKVATGFVASYDKETKVMKYFRDRSLHFNKSSYDHTDYTGISTIGRIYQFESSNTANDIEGKTSGFSGSIDLSFNKGTDNPTGNKLINLGVNFNAGLSESEINKGSGDIVYLDNRPQIVRNSRQKEDIKIILEF